MTSHNTIRQQAHQWRAQIDSARLTAEEKQQFNYWLNQSNEHVQAYAEAEILWKVLGESKSELTQVLPPISNSSRVFNLFSRHKVKLTLASALMALLTVVSVSYLVKQPSEQITSEFAVKKYASNEDTIQVFTLEDGSEITLGRGSQITVRLDKSTRHAELLRGSAFFDIKSDIERPFTLLSGGATIEVLGTRFDVQRKADVVYVAVEKGTVSVSQAFAGWQTNASTEWRADNGGLTQSVELTAGQQVKASRAQGLGKPVVASTEYIGAWRDKKFIYVETPLQEVVADISRLTNKVIVIDENAKPLELSATFNSAQIEPMLSGLQAALPVKITENNQGWEIKLEK